MEPTGDGGDRRISRRRFLRLAGGSLAVGTAAVVLGSAGALRKKPSVENPVARPESRATGAGTRAARPGATPTPLADSTASGPARTPDVRPFSIFWITDTQFLSESNPALFRMLNLWIVENWAGFNGKMVIHTGDVVQNGPAKREWVNADDAMSILMANRIPYTWCAGNHDDLVSDDANSGWRGSEWAQSLNPSVVSAQVNSLPYAHWVGDYHDGMDTAVSFSANGLHFLVINIEWNAQPDTLQWVGRILDDPAYANHHAIMAPHAYIDASGRLDNQRWGGQLAGFTSGLTSLMDAHYPSVFLTLNGHFATESGYNTPEPINNRNELMFDRQDCADAPHDQTGRGVDNPPETDSDKVGGATVTVLTFDTSENQIRARTYDTYLGRWRTDPTEQYGVFMFPNSSPRQKALAE